VNLETSPADFKKGDRVAHPGKPEWGPGIIADAPHDEKVRVLFVEGGEKLLQLKHARLEVFSGEDPRLDRLVSSGDDADSEGPQRAREKFLDLHAEGFTTPAYREVDRATNESAAALMQELLGEDAFAKLLDTEDWAGVAERAIQVLKATKLVVPSERKLLATGLEDAALAQTFARSLCDLLYGFGGEVEDEAEGLRRRFERYVACLKSLRAAKWTLATYFLFMAFPEEHLLLRPTFAQRAATAYGINIRYRAEVGWVTYSRFRELAAAILADTKDLGAEDMLDVQAYIWRLAR
jgi:hypothetical protein